MTDIDSAELARALEQCASEPIHLTGNIQPHGVAVVLSSGLPRRVLQVSANLGGLLDLQGTDPLGGTLEALLGADACVQVEELIETAIRLRDATGAISGGPHGPFGGLLAHVYVSDDCPVLELEGDVGIAQERNLADLLLHAQRSMLSSGVPIAGPEYFRQIATLVRRLTEYDSVMIYRFDGDWNGEVIAQNRTESAPSYLGLLFPASDIPPQARRLYSVNLVRIVCDVDAQPVPLVPALNPQTGAPLDMTFSALRSLSPVHMQYLRNIGVRASMVISLLQGDRLWGLIACHHLSPKRVSLGMRDAAHFLGRLVSWRLSAVDALEDQRLTRRAIDIDNQLLRALPTGKLSAILEQLLPDLRTLLNASGVLALVGGHRHGVGVLPEPRCVDALLQMLARRPGQGVYATDYLASEMPGLAAECSERAAGVLATPLMIGTGDCILWFRGEQLSTVRWAGRYEEGLEQGGDGAARLTPRRSFEAWTEARRGRSVPWSRAERNVAALLGLSLPESLAHKSALELAQELQRAADAERLQMLQEMERQARTDFLTGLPNRRHFLQRAEEELVRAQRYGGGLSLIMLDVDHFKRINDTYGHAAGDAVLRALGERCRALLRTADVPGRLGGEEFAVLLPQTDRMQALDAAERLRAGLASLQVEVPEQGTLLQFTVSLGVASRGPEDTTLARLLQAADAALYAAKQTGRNRVVSSG